MGLSADVLAVKHHVDYGLSLKVKCAGKRFHASVGQSHDVPLLSMLSMLALLFFVQRQEGV